MRSFGFRLEERVEHDLARGRNAELVGELEGLAKQYPLRALRGQLMLALYRSGRQAEALESYQRRSVLVDELGIEPGRQLRELHQVLNRDPALDLVAVQAAPTESSRAAFVGRERELKIGHSLGTPLPGAGVCSCSGEPGIGKSRLADELISRERARGARVLIGRCWEAVALLPTGPGAVAARLHPRDGARDAAPRARRGERTRPAFPELRELFADLPSRRRSSLRAHVSGSSRLRPPS